MTRGTKEEGRPGRTRVAARGRGLNPVGGRHLPPFPPTPVTQQSLEAG